MKAIRIFSIFSFIIFTFPFFQTCSNKEIIENSLIKGSPLIREVPVDDRNFDPNSDSERKKLVYNFLKAQNEMTLSGYGIAVMTFEGFDLPSCVLLICILINAFIAYYAFKMKINRVTAFCLVNIIISLGWLIWLYFADILNDIAQVKFGYYLFVGNLLLIIYFAKKTAYNKG